MYMYFRLMQFIIHQLAQIGMDEIGYGLGTRPKPMTFASILIEHIRKLTNWWGSGKRAVSHPTAAVVYNASYRWFRKRLCTPMHLLACAT